MNKIVEGLLFASILVNFSCTPESTTQPNGIKYLLNPTKSFYVFGYFNGRQTLYESDTFTPYVENGQVSQMNVTRSNGKVYIGLRESAAGSNGTFTFYFDNIYLGDTLSYPANQPISLSQSMFDGIFKDGGRSISSGGQDSIPKVRIEYLAPNGKLYTSNAVQPQPPVFNIQQSDPQSTAYPGLKLFQKIRGIASCFLLNSPSDAVQLNISFVEIMAAP